MNRQSQKPKQDNSSKDSSQNMTMEQLCKLYNIPYRDTTRQHLGESSVIFMGSQKRTENDSLNNNTEELVKTDLNTKSKKKLTMQKPDTKDQGLQIENTSIIHDIRTRVVYMRSKFEPDFLIRSEPSGKCWLKPRGLPEQPIDNQTNMVMSFTLENLQVTKKEYESF